MHLTDLKYGDLLLYRVALRKGGIKQWLSKLIGFFQPVIDEGGSLKRTYFHVSLVDYDTRYELESTWPRSRRHSIAIPKPPHSIEVFRVKRAQEVFNGRPRADAALDWAHEHLGQVYDVWQLVSFGLLDAKNQEVCSSFVARAYSAAGITLSAKGARDKLTSPNEIADNVQEVEYAGTLEV